MTIYCTVLYDIRHSFSSLYIRVYYMLEKLLNMLEFSALKVLEL